MKNDKNLLASIKSIVKPFIPKSILAARLHYLRKNEVSAHDAIFHDKEPRDIFSEVYAKAMWGKIQDTDPFCSGHGSHLPTHVSPYVATVSDFLGAFSPPLNAVDLGCGDFNVGSQIRSCCARYIACDVVPKLIQRNKEKFAGLDVDFRCVDIINLFSSVEDAKNAANSAMIRVCDRTWESPNG